VVVEHPERCKPHCPACARICPKAAIVFAKHDEAPIDGSPVGSDEEAGARARRDLHAMLGDDPLAALAERRRRARPASVVDPERLRQALAERQSHGGRAAPAAGERPS
jgi:ferredoxin